MLRQRGVEAGFDAGPADMRRQIDRRGNFVHRHFPRLVVRAGKRLVHADGENRQIIEEERIEMVGVEHHDHVGPHGGKMFLLRREQLGGFAVGAVALDEERKHRGMRHAKSGDDICHLVELLAGFTSAQVLCNISPRGAKPPEHNIARSFGRNTCRASQPRNASTKSSLPPQRVAPRERTAPPQPAVPTEHDRFDLFGDRRPAAAVLAERRPRRAVGHPQHRAFSVRPPLDAADRPAGQSGCAQLFVARLRRARRHLADDGGDGEIRREGHRRAQLGCLQALSAHHRRGKKTRLGVDGTRHQQFDADQQPVGGRGARADQGGRRHHHQERRQGAARLAQPGLERDRAHARHPRRERHRVCRQLGQRRPALSDAGEERAR